MNPIPPNRPLYAKIGYQKTVIEKKSKRIAKLTAERDRLRKLVKQNAIDIREQVFVERMKLVQKERHIDARIEKLAEQKAIEIFEAYKLGRTGVLDGVLVYMCMNFYRSTYKLPPSDMAYLILINIKGKMIVRDFVKYNLASSLFARRHLEYLVQEGFVECFRDVRPMYFIPSMKGQKAFKGFREFYNKTLKEYIGTDEYKRAAYKWAE